MDSAGGLVAFGIAVPPPHVCTAAAAELWALMIVLTVKIAPPIVTTDCLAIHIAAGAGSALLLNVITTGELLLLLLVLVPSRDLLFSLGF